MTDNCRLFVSELLMRAGRPGSDSGGLMKHPEPSRATEEKAF
jgi:hypothetical protein